MKKTMALVIGISFGSALFFAGCGAETNADGGNSSEKAHTHTLSYTAAAEATCTETGNTAYWYCAECGTYFSDEAATVEIALSDTVVAALGHNYVNGACTRCGAEVASEGLEYELSSDGTYTGIGIGTYAFYGCTALTNIAVPDSVTVIGDRAFQLCSAMTAALVDSGLTEIGNYAFRECTALASITIPANVTRIGCFAFYQCASLSSVTFADTGGWYVLRTESASVGTDITVTDSASAAAHLTSTYCRYY